MGQNPSPPAKPPPPPASTHRSLHRSCTAPQGTLESFKHPTSQINSFLKWLRPGPEGEHPNSPPNHRRAGGALLTSAHENRQHRQASRGQKGRTGRQEPGNFSAMQKRPDRGTRPSGAPTPRTARALRPGPGPALVLARAGGQAAGQAHLAGAPAPSMRLNFQCHTRRVPLMQKQSLGGRALGRCLERKW